MSQQEISKSPEQGHVMPPVPLLLEEEAPLHPKAEGVLRVVYLVFKVTEVVVTLLRESF